jgi:phage gp36-like protein
VSTYAVEADLIKRFGQAEILALSDLDRSGAIDHTRTAQALADASAEIDGYLQSRYQLPLSDVPAMLSLLCCNVARYLLMGTRPTEEARSRYDDAIKYLRDIATGKFGLGLDPSSGTPAPVTTATLVQRDRVFSGDALRDFTSPYVGRRP